ncbi:MAG: FeoA family protein [Pseudomonadota bacterium]|nr:FeoA family protein [Pseudomonadota bacterium]
MGEQKFVSLHRLAPGTRGIVRRLQGGNEFASRLVAMGLSIGSEFEVLQNRGHGPVIVLVRDTRIALGRSEALKIVVEELERERRETE